VRRVLAAGAAVALAVAGVVGFVGAGTARAAYTSACAEAPDPVTIGDGTGAAQVLEEGAEVRELRRELALACLALAERAEAGVSAEADTTGAVGRVADKLDVVATKLDRLHEDLTSSPPVSGRVELGSETLSAQHDAAAQLDGDLWILVGVVCGLWAMGEVLRRVFS
jgi:hypothetical protein